MHYAPRFYIQFLVYLHIKRTLLVRIPPLVFPFFKSCVIAIVKRSKNILQSSLETDFISLIISGCLIRLNLTKPQFSYSNVFFIKCVLPIFLVPVTNNAFIHYKSNL